MAVTLSLFAGAGAQFFDNTGNVLSGGKIYTYQAGTTTPLAVYTSNNESAFHTNPIILDSAGRVPSGGEIWLQLGVGYKFVLRTSAEVLIATYDNIPSSAQPPAANDADSIMYEQGYTVTAGSFVVGKIYRIASVGTTNFTLIGAASNTIGTHFIAGGAGTGTGTAELSQTVETKLRETVSAQDFGAVGDGVTDDTAAIQAFFSYISATKVNFATCNGSFAISSGVTLGPASVLIPTTYISGDADFIALNAIDTMLTIRFCGNTNDALVWDGKINCTGVVGTSYASRTCRVGVSVYATARARFGGIRNRYFSQSGLDVDSALGNNNETDFGFVQAYNCGSGQGSGDLTATYSNPVDSGSSGSIGQRTIIDVDVLPPTNTVSNVTVMINGKMYYVYTIDTVNSKLEVYPWVDSTVPTGSLVYYFGGAVCIKGSDSGILKFQGIDALNCGHGLFVSSLYGPVVSALVAQSCGSGLTVGATPSAAQVTTTVTGYYCEGNEIDLFRVSRTNLGLTIGGTYGFAYSKVQNTDAARLSSNELNVGVSGSLNTIAIFDRGQLLTFEKPINNETITSIDVNKPYTNLIFKDDSQNIALTEFDADKNAAFGYNSAAVTYLGTGAGNAPTGAFVFTAPAGTTVNGGATASFSGLTGPTTFNVFYDIAATNFVVWTS
jgi:hypothetical protein